MRPSRPRTGGRCPAIPDVVDITHGAQALIKTSRLVAIQQLRYDLKTRAQRNNTQAASNQADYAYNELIA